MLVIRVVREARFELAILSELAPQASAYTSSATRALRLVFYTIICLFQYYFLLKAFSIFAQLSRKETILLNTIFLSEDMVESTQKYPCLSNWKRSPGFASLRNGSKRQDVNIFKDLLNLFLLNAVFFK